MPSSEADEIRRSLNGLLEDCERISGYLVEYMSVPVGVKDGGSVSAEEGHQLGGAAILVDGDDGKSTTTACFPVDRDVLRIGLEDVSGHIRRSRARLS